MLYSCSDLRIRPISAHELRPRPLNVASPPAQAPTPSKTPQPTIPVAWARPLTTPVVAAGLALPEPGAQFWR
eukprot:260597-Prymnesium_polylepis.1